MPYVFDFDHSHSRPPMDMKDLLGGKGANLAEMTSVLRLPVPPGFTISTDACRAYMEGGWPEGLTAEVTRARTRLEELDNRRRSGVERGHLPDFTTAPAEHRDIVDKLNAEINAGLKDPKILARLADFGATAFIASPVELDQLVVEQTEKWGRVIRAANIKVD